MGAAGGSDAAGRIHRGSPSHRLDSSAGTEAAASRCRCCTGTRTGRLPRRPLRRRRLLRLPRTRSVRQARTCRSPLAGRVPGSRRGAHLEPAAPRRAWPRMIS